MRKTIISLFLLLSVWVVFSCDGVKVDSGDDEVDFGSRKYVAVGDGLTTGVQSNGLVIDFQLHSFPFFIAQQLMMEIQNNGLVPSGMPFNGGFTLTSSEQDIIKNTVEEFNSPISDIAFDSNVPVVDANTLLSKINNEGIDGFTGEFVLVDNVNTAFSLDGVHPNNAGYAIIANEFIKVLNDSFGMNITPVNTDQFRGQYAN